MIFPSSFPLVCKRALEVETNARAGVDRNSRKCETNDRTFQLTFMTPLFDY